MKLLQTRIFFLIMILLSWIMVDVSFAQYEFEKGDAIYRKAVALPIVGHAALYRDWNEPLGGPVADVQMNQQRIIEMQEDGMHTDHTVQDSLDAVGPDNFWGPAYLANLSATQRREIIATALSFTNAHYNFFSGYKNPNGDPPTFRCDGLVEYCYEQALGDDWEPGKNGGIIKDDTYLTLSPIKQYSNLIHRTEAEKPQIELKTPSGNIIQDGEKITDHNISAFATDGEKGSGLTRFEVWRGDPNAGGVEIISFRDNHDYDIDHLYDVNNLPGGHIYMRFFDQAGNYLIREFFVKERLDLVFLIDTTGSMWDDIAAAKLAAVDIVNQVDSQTDDYRIAVVDFRDFPVNPYGGSGDYPYHVDLPFSTEKSSIVSAIQGITLGNGADWRESHYSALMYCLQKNNLGGWRDDVKKVIILMTDAPPHDPEPFTGYTMSDVTGAAIALDPAIIYPISIGWDSVARSYMETLAEETGGAVFPATSAGDVVDAIMSAIETTFSAPTAEADGPYSGEVGTPITFDGSSSYDSDGEVVSYEWDIDNDGVYDISSSDPTVTYTYLFEYSGLIKLRVTDNDGLTGIDTAEVEINAPSVPGDLDDDGDVDRDDVNIIQLYRNQPASVCPECDIDGDGTITVLDARKIMLMCTCPRCMCP